MKLVAKDRDCYALTYTDNGGLKLVEVDANDSSLEEAVKDIRDTGYTGPIEVATRWILVGENEEGELEEYVLEDIISTQTIE